MPLLVPLQVQNLRIREEDLRKGGGLRSRLQLWYAQKTALGVIRTIIDISLLIRFGLQA